MHRYLLLCTLVLTLALPGTLSLAGDSQADKVAGPYYDLGGFHRDATTESEAAQVWFDRGLAMCYAFNHEEAIRCFEHAVEADPSMAMAYWGMAYAWGPNINYLDIPADQMGQASAVLRLAELHASGASKLEQELIAALAQRHAIPVPEDRQALNQAYADAMREVYEANANDPFVAALFAESLMNLQPWKHFTPEGEMAEHTPEIVAVLERGLEQNPDYPALCHLYIHTMEASTNPGIALPAADVLRDAMPEAGHMVHMPSHIDVLVGDYDAVIRANQLAIAADELFLEKEGPYNFYSLYRIHNYHFLVYGAMFDGQSELAMRTARAIPQQVPEDLIVEWVDFLDAFIPTPLHVMVRFGRWEEILEEPDFPDYLPMARSIRHYARALAYSALCRVEEAEAEYAAFEETRTTVPESSMLFNNTSRSILEVANAMVAGEIAYRKGDYDTAFANLREAVQLDDALNYDEPWGWMQPARHALGALLLEQGNFADAEAVYQADLRRHPKNVWALHGLAESLEKQDRLAEADAIRVSFDSAVVRADIEVDRSCYCRVNDLVVQQ
jgi:tetratricopeptide (TPR) repeat protein